MRRANRKDVNEEGIVKALREIRGLTVKMDMDDILVGFRQRTYWYEIKDPDKLFKKDGTYRKGALKDSQIKLEREWMGHYKIVSTLDEILKDLDII